VGVKLSRQDEKFRFSGRGKSTVAREKKKGFEGKKANVEKARKIAPQKGQESLRTKYVLKIWLEWGGR